MKRKRYNSDDYILDDQAFLDDEKKIEPVKKSVTSIPVSAQIIRTPKPNRKATELVSASTSPKVEKLYASKYEAGSSKKQSPISLANQGNIKINSYDPKIIEKHLTLPSQTSLLANNSSSALLDVQTPTRKVMDKIKKCEMKKKIKDGRKGKDKDSGTSSEEERWLDAIESGKLEEVDDELKKIKPKDPKFMTARQRAMYEKNTEKEMTNPITQHLMSLPSGYKEKVLTAEAIQKAQLKSQKRKQLADEKREKDKRKTMERLLKKKDSKSVKQIKHRPFKLLIPRISYQQTMNNAKIIVPEELEFPFKPQVARNPPKQVLCSILNCQNIKRYNCSKTNVPLCSLKCYKLINKQAN